MKILSFEKDGLPVCGVHHSNAAGQDVVVDLSLAAPDLPGTWPEILGALLLSKVEAAAQSAPAAAQLATADLKILPPIPDPRKILCAGLNYHDHAKEVGADIPTHPVFFTRYPASVVGASEALVCPSVSEQFDFEAELVAVIGKGGRHISVDDALGHVVGYTAMNEGSVRDFQFKSTQWILGKNFDRSGSVGPHIVTADELPPGGAGLRIMTRLNGETVQDSNTDELIFDVATLVHHASTAMTLEPGDLIATGTPPGVGVGRKPPLWMKPGDSCEIEIEGIGCISNRVVAESG